MTVHNPSTSQQLFPADSWRAALACGPNGGNCVEVNLAASGSVGVRDNKPNVRPVLVFTSVNWATFIAATRADAINA